MTLQAQEKDKVSRHTRLWTAVAVAVVIVVLLAAFASRRGETPVLVERAVRQSILASIDTNGVIEPVNNFRAHAPAPAVVREIAVREGESVKAGDLLLRLDDADARVQEARALFQLRAAEAELSALQSGGTREEVLTTQTELGSTRAELDSAQRNFAAMQRLQQQGAASIAEVRDAEARLNTAKAQVELLEKKLGSRFADSDRTRAQARLDEAKAAHLAALQLVRNSNVRAPRAGTVFSLPVRSGEFVNAGELLVQVADLDHVQARIFVDEPDVGRLREGQEVLVTWDALPGKSWSGSIVQVPATVVSRGTRNVGEAVANVDNSGRQLLPNVNVSAKIVSARQANVLTLSREAVRDDNGMRYVFQVQNGTLKRQAVTTGVSNLTSVEITGGLSDGAQVATSSPAGTPLEPEMAVRVLQP